MPYLTVKKNGEIDLINDFIILNKSIYLIHSFMFAGIKYVVAIEFYIILFTFSFLNIFLALTLNTTSLVLIKKVENNIINVKLGFSATLRGNSCKQHCNVNMNKLI